jgi:lipopolysaccharide export system protein LptA
MATSVRSALGCAAALALAWLGHASAAAPAREPIQLDAQSSELDYGTNQLLFRKVRITQGAMSISADQAHATGLDFENSHWVFSGDVRIIMAQGQLSSEQADATFEKKLLAQVVITGHPASFAQGAAPAGKSPVQGHANTIDYNVAKDTVHLTGNAWLSDGQTEIRHDSLTYSVKDRKMVADASEQGAQRVHITITPPPAGPKP